jgi:hypothetical protein
MMLAKASARLGMVPAPAYLGPPPPNAPDATPPRLELDADAVGRTRAVYFDDDGQAQHVRNSHFSGDAEKELERVKKEKDEVSILLADALSRIARMEAEARAHGAGGAC